MYNRSERPIYYLLGPKHGIKNCFIAQAQRRFVLLNITLILYIQKMFAILDFDINEEKKG